MESIKSKILHTLLDKYERSKTFSETNTVIQSFSVRPEQLFEGYLDDAKFVLFQDVNSVIAELKETGYISVRQKKNGVVSSILLNVEMIHDIYAVLHRQPLKIKQENQRVLLTKYLGKNDLLDAYCREQLQRLNDNKSIRAFDDFGSFESILKTLDAIFKVEEETFQRDFSSRVLGDSKAFEKIREKVASILMEYGDFADRETVFEDLNIVKNPGHVFFKGKAIIKVSEQTIYLENMKGDIALSSALLKDLQSVQVLGGKVITIENLTTFNSFSDDDALIIYLGGYHNSIRRHFIQKIYEQNPKAIYYHFGDIDAGGFYILEHLRRKTGIAFQALNMDVQTLLEHKGSWKSLTENDKKRLQNLSDSEFAPTIHFMLQHGCKLEQETLDY